MRKGGGDRDVGERVMRQDNGWWYVRILRRRLTPRGMFPEVQRVEDWWWIMDGDTWGSGDGMMLAAVGWAGRGKERTKFGSVQKEPRIVEEAGGGGV